MNRTRLAGSIDRRGFWFGLILLWVAWLFAPCLLGYQRLAFRDVGHFYLPLYSLLGERFAGDGLPLWNPWDRFGMPVAGETTTAIFYPPRLLFSSALPADYAMTLYVVGHLLLAGGGAYWAARGTFARAPEKFARGGGRATPLASLAAAVVYPAAGPVFFLYTNPPFLVGAAWLPWALSGLLRSSHRPSLGSVSIASIALAMAILGGDPQLAFHALLFSSGYWAFLRLRTLWTTRAHAKTTAARGSQGPPARLLPLLACVLIASGLSSLQIFAGAAWSLQSWRHASQPPSLYSHLASPFQSPTDEAAGPRPTTARPTAAPRHAADIYDYSVAPWHWAELASPFLAGRLFPANGRLSELIPGEPRIWTLTLYAGLLPLLCLLASPLDPRRWTVWHALVAAGLLLSLGDFGPARVFRGGLELCGLAMPAGIPDAAGGGYWGLVTFIPGYGQFRYPAKWLPFAALGIAVWSSLFLSYSDRRARCRAGRIAWGVGLVAVVFFALTWLPGFHVGLAERASSGRFGDAFWGPLDLSTGLHSLRSSLLITASFAAVYGILFGGFSSFRWGGKVHMPRWLRSLTPTLARRQVVALSLAALIADLLLSTSWQLATVARPLASAAAETSAPSGTIGAPPRRYLSTATAQDWPTRWRLTSSDDRLQEVESAQREVWFMRWHLADRAAVVNSAVSIASTRSNLFWNEARQYALALPPAERRGFIESLHRFAGIEAEFDYRSSPQPTSDAPLRLRFTPVAAPSPLVRWHSTWRWTEAAPARRNDIDAIAGQLQVLFGEIHQRREAAIPRLESQSNTPRRSPPDPLRTASESVPHTRVTLVSWRPERVRIHVDAPTAGLVTFSQLQDGYWRARLRSATDGSIQDRSASQANWRAATVYRADIIAQGVHVPAGRHVLEFYYRPTWLLPGTLLTLFTIAALAICGLKKRRFFGRYNGV